MVEELQTEATEKEREKDELSATAEDLKIKLERAGQLVDGLAGEKVRWEISITNFDRQLGNLAGDVTIAAAFLSYAGPFGATYRENLVARVPADLHPSPVIRYPWHAVPP